MNPKTRKLLTTPHLFLRDMARNRVRAIAQRAPRVHTVTGRHRFSVIVATDGSSQRLPELLRSLVRQTLDFERHIEVLLVGYGAVESPEVSSWCERFPLSIRFLRDDGGTRSSAWNCGLEHMEGDWVIFMSPDHFVHERYFERLDDFLCGPYAGDLALLFSKTLVYVEERNIFKNADPLRARFKQGDAIVNTADLTQHVQPCHTAALFRADRVRATGLRFDRNLDVGFDDGNFIGRYLLQSDGSDVGFAASARYYRRQPSDDTKRMFPSVADRLRGQIESEYEDLLTAAEAELGFVPKWLQRTVLYGLMKYIRYFMNHEERLTYASPSDRQELIEAFRRIFRHLDSSTVQTFSMAGCRRIQRIGMLGLFKGEHPDIRYVRVESYDPSQELIQLRSFYWEDPEEVSYALDDEPVYPQFSKVRRYELFGETFARERIAWLPAKGEMERLRVRIGGQEASLGTRGKIYRGGVLLSRLKGEMRPKTHRKRPWYERAEHLIANNPVTKRQYTGAFLFMDRDISADDNAEHLYRYLLRARPDLPAYFVLRRFSRDWARLEREGFRLIEYGSIQHRHALIHAKHIVSSHASPFVMSDGSGRKFNAPGRRFTFLQHGVIKDDLSGWLNGWNIDCFITASPAEYLSIAGDGPYKFSAREVILSGLPRHDALGRCASPSKPKLLIMPTWRQSVAGTLDANSSARKVNPAFYESHYGRCWKRVLHAPLLESLARNFGYEVLFLPHPNTEPYLDWFDPPPFIQTHKNTALPSIQTAFQSATFMLTDYSSTAFDMAYLRKPTVYYQFDVDEVFSGGHTTKKGYFEYERDGFGPVCYDEASLFEALEDLVLANGVADAVYRDRMERAFAYRDGKNCERVLAAILDLDAPASTRGSAATLKPRDAEVRGAGTIATETVLDAE